MSKVNLKTLKEYINKNLKKKFIKLSNLLIKSLILFILIKIKIKDFILIIEN